VTVLTSANPLDENTFEAPEKIVPQTSPLRVSGTSFVHTFPAYSLTILRIAAR
jgi:alpha-L-arabinofuranosidase